MSERPQLSAETILQQSKRTASRVVEGQAVVIVIDRQDLHTLDEVGTFIWSRAEGATIGQIVEDIIAEFDVEEEEATKDVVAFAHHLMQLGALEPVGGLR